MNRATISRAKKPSAITITIDPNPNPFIPRSDFFVARRSMQWMLPGKAESDSNGGDGCGRNRAIKDCQGSTRQRMPRPPRKIEGPIKSWAAYLIGGPGLDHGSTSAGAGLN
jgi:hypothetical protein